MACAFELRVRDGARWLLTMRNQGSGSGVTYTHKRPAEGVRDARRQVREGGITPQRPSDLRGQVY